MILPVPQNGSGIRGYDKTACRWVELIKCMRWVGGQIEALIGYVPLFRRGYETLEVRRALLVER